MTLRLSPRGAELPVATAPTGSARIRIDTVARSVRDEGMITVDGAADAIARNQIEFVQISDERIAWSSRL